jgi:hypothetical protein
MALKRLSNGLFAPGNAGGPGNPHASKMLELRAALQAALTPADMTAIILKMRDMAIAGDCNAAKLVLERACGKPIEEINLAVSGGLDLSHLDDATLGRMAASADVSVEELKDNVL